MILLLYFALSLNKYLNQKCLSDGSIMWFRVKTGYEISQELQILSRSLSNCQSLNLDVIGSLNLSGIVNCVKEWLNHCGILAVCLLDIILVAVGLLAVGLLAVGLLPVGLLAVGLLAEDLLAVGLLAID